MKKIIFFTLVAALLPAIFFVMVGCMKKPDHKADYGPEVDINQVQQALDELGTPDPMTIKKGEFSYAETTVAIDTGIPELAMQSGTTVTEKTTTAGNIQLHVVFDNRVLENGELKPDPKEKTYCIELVPGGCSANPTTLAMTSKSHFENVSAFADRTLRIAQAGSQVSTQAAKRTYHNLKKSIVNWPVPSLVQMRSDCGGLKNCTSFPATKVSFDEVIWENEQKGHKSSFLVVSSAEILPFFAADVLFCIQDWKDIQGRIVPITQCTEMKDFTFGKDTVAAIKKIKKQVAAAPAAETKSLDLMSIISFDQQKAKAPQKTSDVKKAGSLIFR